MTRSASSSLNLFLRVSAAHFLRPITIWTSTDTRTYMHPHASHRKKHIYLYLESKQIPLRHIRTVLAPVVTEIRAHQNLKTQLHPSAPDLENHKSHLPSKFDSETLVHCVLLNIWFRHISSNALLFSWEKKSQMIFIVYILKHQAHVESTSPSSIWSGLIIKCLYI